MSLHQCQAVCPCGWRGDTLTDNYDGLQAALRQALDHPCRTSHYAAPWRSIYGTVYEGRMVHLVSAVVEHFPEQAEVTA